MDLYRIRIQLNDEPSCLGRAAAALGSLGVNILDIDVQSLDGQRRADDLLVDLTIPLDLPAIDVALREAGCTVLDMRPADPHELTDSDSRNLELAAALLSREGDLSMERLADAARRLIRADLAWIEPATALQSCEAEINDFARRADTTGVPVVGRAPVERLPRQESWPWTLAVPFAMDGRDHVVVLIRRKPRFSFSETARVQALLRLVVSACSSTRASRARHPSTHPR